MQLLNAIQSWLGTLNPTSLFKPAAKGMTAVLDTSTHKDAHIALLISFPEALLQLPLEQQFE